MRPLGGAFWQDADRRPLCSSRPTACSEPAVTAPDHCSPVFIPAACPERVPYRAGCLRGPHFILKKVTVSLHSALNPFVLDPVCKVFSLPASPTSLLLLLPSLPCPAHPLPHLPFLVFQIKAQDFFAWKSEIEELSPFPLLQDKIFSWKGVPWGPGGVPPYPPGPGDQHLQAGNTQTIVRPGPPGLERAASLAETTDATTTTIGDWST